MLIYCRFSGQRVIFIQYGKQGEPTPILTNEGKPGKVIKPILYKI